VSRLLVIMGSGETAPTMVKPHRAIFELTGDGSALLLDTPYGFQSNADDISARAMGYFSASVGRRVEVLSWRTRPTSALARERAVTALRGARWVFAGPGSPTYALRMWRDTPVPELLLDKLTRGGTVVFASAAALTLGSHSVPVYEIYKAGVDPHWVPGLDLIRSVTGLPAVVIPHYDNAEGGHHDTRFCYLGESRLAAMERELPAEAFVLGVDEHTAVLLDLDARTASVLGNGTMTIRRGGTSTVHPTGSVLTFSALTSASSPILQLWPPANGVNRGEAATTAARSTEAPSLRAEADRLDAVFTTALTDRDVDGCVAVILDLEQVLVDWSADTLTSDEGDHARAVLRGMVVRLGALAEAGARDPRQWLAPFVTALLEVRAQARQTRDWATSDRIRDQLAAAGVEVRDTGDGVAWELR
jgi:cyanophycinase-like exopeptidase